MRDQRRPLESHTRKCVFVGYPDNRPGWMFWDAASRKLVYSDSAEFDERDFPGATVPKESIPDLSPEIEISLIPAQNEVQTSVAPEAANEDANEGADEGVDKGGDEEGDEDVNEPADPVVVVGGVPVPAPANELAPVRGAQFPEQSANCMCTMIDDQKTFQHDERQEAGYWGH